MCIFVQNSLEDKCRFTPYDAPRPLGSGACCGARIALLSRVGILRILQYRAESVGMKMLPVGAGLPAKTACQPMHIYLIPHDQTVGAGLLAKVA